MRGFKLGITAGLVLTTLIPVHAAVRGPAWDVTTDQKTGLVRVLSGGLTAPLGKNPEEAARFFLTGHGEVLARKTVEGELTHAKTTRSPAGHHVRFTHVRQGLPVIGAGVTVHMDDTMRVRMVTARPRGVVLAAPTKAEIPADTAMHAAKTAVKVAGALRADAKAELALLPEEGADRLVYRVSVPARQPLGDWEVLVDAKSGAVLSQRNLLQRAHGQVFDPNPCVTLKNTKIADRNNESAAVDKSAYKKVELRGLNGSGKLIGPFVDVSESTGGAATEASGEYIYERGDHRFEQVMIYHHIDRAQRYIQSLGFANVLAKPIKVDAHGLQDDNSFYSPMTKRLAFGDGGVDDAEDADIIMHEYGHALQDDQVPGFGASGEARAMGEGFGDYLAGSVRSDQSFHPLAVAIWDGTAYSQQDPPNLRRLDSKKHYPEDLRGQFHADGEMWSAALRQIWQQLGAKATDKLIFQAHFFMEADTTFAEGAEAVLQADRQINGGANQEKIRAIFVARGFLKAGGGLQIATNPVVPTAPPVVPVLPTTPTGPVYPPLWKAD
jgi:Zn-dependent metalloprotease